MFCRRLGDIAERLFFIEVDERKDTLKGDLEMLNASGRLGGDPLNQICDNSNELINVMHIPSDEGHVFRSKERTPVLLLMEIINDQKIFENTPNSPKKPNSEKVLPTSDNNAESQDSHAHINISDLIDLSEGEKEDDQSKSGTGDEQSAGMDLLGMSASLQNDSKSITSCESKTTLTQKEITSLLVYAHLLIHICTLSNYRPSFPITWSTPVT